MSDDIQKKVLLNVALANKEAQSEMQSLTTTVNQLAAATKELQTVTKNSQTAFNGYNEKLAQSKLTAQQNREEITRLNLVRRQEADAVNNAKKAIVAAKGSYDEAQKSLTALGRAIKSAEGGFNSTNPAIQKQIASYNQLNAKLTAFDKKLGNHQRNVGNYAGALQGITAQLGQLVPGFSQFSSILQSATQNFSAMKGSAAQATGALQESGVAATEAEGAISAGALAAGASIAAVVAGLIVEGTYLLQFQKYADGLSKTWAGVKAGGIAAMNVINDTGKESEKTGNLFADLGVKAVMAFTDASNAQGKILETSRLVNMSAVQTSEENDKIRKDMLVIRNIKSDEVTVEKAYQDALKLTGDQYDRNKKLQDALHASIVKKDAAAFSLTKGEIDGLNDVQGGYTKIIKLAHDLVAQNKLAASSLDDIIASAQKGVEIEGTKEVREQMIQNREDQKQAKLEKQRQAALTAEQKEADELMRIKQATEQANSERLASITKMLGYQREAFAKELSDADEHYRQLIFKQQEFIEKQQAIVNSKKSTPKEKAAAQGAISAGKDDIAQLQKEHYAEQEKLLLDHAKTMREETQKAANDLAQLQIQSIGDDQERERQSDELTFKEKNQALNKEITAYRENERKLIVEIGTATPERIAILTKELADTQNLIDKANDKRVETQEQFQDKSLDNLKKFALKRKLIEDELAIMAAQDTSGFSGGEDNPFNKKLENAQVTQANDQTQDQLQSKGLDEDKNKDGTEFSTQQLLQKQKITKQGEDAVTKIKKDAAKKRTDMEIDAAKQVSDASFSIIQQSLQRQEQANEMFLERQKGHDLSNRSLTETQKYEVAEKYRALEGQAKVKAFKQEQEIALAKAVIDTAAAVLKASPIVPLMVLAGITGALEIGVIASERAPAYATGRGPIHYASDGKGTLLNGPGNGTSDSMNARVSNGESIINAKSTSWFAPLLSALNVAGGGKAFTQTSTANPWFTPGFASGGVFNNYLPTADNGLRPNIPGTTGGRLHPNDINGIVGGIVNGVSEAVSNLPVPVMDIKDVNHAQSRLSTPYDRLNY